MVFVCRSDHALADRDRVGVADLREEMILRFPPGWGVRAIVDGALGDTQSAFEIIDYTLMMRLARAGFGTTLVPASAVEGERGEGLRDPVGRPGHAVEPVGGCERRSSADGRHEDPPRRAYPGQQVTTARRCG